jgi:acyl carrier protein
MIGNDDIFTRVSTVVRRTFQLDDSAPVTRETTSADVDGWDSLAHSVLLMGVEDEFGITFDAETMFELENVGALADLVGSRLAE